MEFIRAGDFIINKLTKELPAQFTYHNVAHTRDVYTAAEKIASFENVSATDLILLLTAAFYHDAGFLIKANGHEEESCKLVMDLLPLFGYTDSNINTMCAMIMATKMPQTPKTLLERILADADLDYLGRDDFFEVGQRLYSELTNTGAIDTLCEWNKLQLEFMQAHQYFTRSAGNLRQDGKENNIIQIRTRILKQINR